MTAGEATLNITCREHGLIFSERVVCHHDVTEAMERVGHAHSASYGAACMATLDVAVTGDGNVLEQWSRYPGVATEAAGPRCICPDDLIGSLGGCPAHDGVAS